MSISNNIAEGAGSDYNQEFKKFLSYARRSCFECANIVILLNRRNLVAEIEMIALKDKLDHLSRKITKFKNRI